MDNTQKTCFCKSQVKGLKDLGCKQRIDLGMGSQPAIHYFCRFVIPLILQQNIAPATGEDNIPCPLDFFKRIQRRHYVCQCFLLSVAMEG